ncbi:MAG: glycosyltransferase [Ignavibacteriaceae bacterium]|nr:glycosyltransferase [Ignavibacteriaceae bacterium]
MFKVLVIAYYFPPKGLSGVQRTLKFVKYFNKYNWFPTVVTSGEGAYYAHDNTLLDDLEPGTYKLHRVEGKDINSLTKQLGTVRMPNEVLRKIFSFFSSFFFIPDNKKYWSKKVLNYCRELLKNEEFDVIFISGPPFSSFETGRALKKEFNIPLVYDYRDLWYGYHFAIYPTIFHRLMIKRMEYRCLKKADRIIVTNRKIKEKLVKFFPFLGLNSISIIPHGFDPQDITAAGKHPKDREKLIFTYSGIFYEFITPKYFLKAFKLLTQENPEIASRIELHFAGLLRKENEKLIESLKLQSYVRYFGYLDHLDAIKKLNSSDVLWITVGEGRNSDTISSGKLFEYFGTGKPVLGLLREGALKSALEEYGSSFICDPYDVRGIKDKFVEIFLLYSQNALPAPKSEVIAKYNREYLTEILTKELQFLVKVR